MLSEYVHELARNLAPLRIRANVIHPTNVDTDMLRSDPIYRSFRPDLENPTFEVAVLFLASNEARYITGMQLRVGAGGYLKWYDYHA